MKIISKQLFFLLTIIVCFSPNLLFSQDIQNSRRTSHPDNGKKLTGTISGKVIDATTNEELQYVNVVILRPKDSSIVNGTITDEKGKFNIKENYGKHILRLSFIGYKDNFISVDLKNENTSLGTIKLNQSAATLNGVVITAERSMMEYQLDKRVINVDKNLVSAGGSASDVLENVPSVSVDEDGGVTLRGNSNVKVLIDGKPSELLGNDLATILASIPASTIATIEVITNPSAKYDPEGMSGIINIKLKEKGNRGLNGNVSVSTGSSLQKFLPTTSISTGLNYSTKKFGLSASLDGRFNERGSINDNIKTLFGNETNPIEAFVYSKRDDIHKMLGGGLKLGGDWYINEKNTLTLTYSNRSNQSPDNNTTTYNKDLWNPMSSRSINQNDKGNFKGIFNTFALNYQKKFNKPDQELTIDANWNMGSFDRENTQTLDYYNDSIPNYTKKDEGINKFNRAVVTANYSHPFTENLKLEVGYNLNYSNSHSEFDYFINGNPLRDEGMSYVYDNDEQIHAIYATLGYNFGKKFSALLGFRGELVKSKGTKTMADDSDVSFVKDYVSPFPSLHFSYSITQTQSAQISYSRRINRPDGHDLLPNVDLSNPEQIRFGNPDLDPEYTDAFELGYSIIFPKTTIYASTYYRKTNNEITRFNFLWTAANANKYGFNWVMDVAGDEVDKGKLAQTSLNIAQSSNYGLELIIDQQITKWWKINLSGNLFGNYSDAKVINGTTINSLNWDAKINSTMNLPKEWTIQISGQYYAPRATIQGDMKEQYFADLAIKKNILNKKGTLSLSYRDMFGTRSRVSRTLTEDYFLYSYNRQYGQSISINFSYRFGQNDFQKQKRKKQEQEPNGSNMEGIDE